MRILGIETSCDETAAAIVTSSENSLMVTLLTNIVASSLALHAKTGGIIPEIAAREQNKYIIPVIQQALQTVNITEGQIDAIAVTFGPGLIGSLLVGVETAKTLAFAWNKPIIPVNHLIGHIYANFINHETLHKELIFPAIALLISGGHTDLLLMKNYKDLTWLGGTRDDAAGEAFDKVGRLLGLPYPAGPVIEQLAHIGNQKAIDFPRPMIHTSDYDFSFSGLKTAALRQVQKLGKVTQDEKTIADLAASFQQAVFDVLITKTLIAAKKYKVRSILLAGGVATNQTLRNQFLAAIKKQQLDTAFFAPPKNLCTDNAAMIATAASFYNKPVPWQEVTANPELYFA